MDRLTETQSLHQKRVSLWYRHQGGFCLFDDQVRLACRKLSWQAVPHNSR